MLAEIKSFIPDQIRHLKIGRFRRNKIKEIPIELLIEIFLHCLPTDRFPIPSRCEAPILLGRVCRVWRSVSLNTPQLWAQITLSSWYYPIDIWKSENFHRIGIHEWIRRSGNSPFSFEIGVHDEEHISAPLLTLTLRAEARRWKSVRLQTNCYCMHHILHILWIPGHTPMLTDLRFHTTDSFKKYYMPITSAPQLSTFYLDSRYNPFFKSGKFHALREFRINPYGSPQPFFQILMQCPLLEIFEIMSPWKYPQYGTEMVVYTLSHLRTFILGGIGGDGRLWMLNSLDAPALNSLAISMRKNRPESFSENSHLSSFLMRCGSHLQRLKLAGGFVAPNDLLNFLRHTPILESLCVESDLLVGDLAALCPPIVHFDILVAYSHTDQTLNAVDAILSRWKDNRLKDCASTISPPIIRVPSDTLSVVLKHRGVNECIQRGLRVVHLRSEKECWWATRLDP